MDKIDLKGLWWLPGNEEKVVGTLKFDSDEGANLEVVGRFFNDNKFEVDIILGRTSNGEDITLYKCFIMSSSYNNKGGSVTKIYSNIIFEGVHFNQLADINFKEISCHYSNLDEWAWMNGFDVKQNFNNQIEVKYQLPSKEIVEINEDYTVEIYPDIQVPNNNLVQKEMTISQKIYTKIINKNSESFEEHMNELRHIQNFISLGISKPVVIMELVGKTEFNREFYNEYIHYPIVKIYFKVKSLEQSQKNIVPMQMLFNLQDIKAELKDILKLWFNKKEILGSIIDLYFGTQYNSDMYLEQKFSYLVQAIEAYHRRTRKNSGIEDDKHEQRIASILSSVEGEYKEWLKERLSYSNEPILRDRLKELVSECAEILELNSRGKTRFIYKICNTRNYFTHYDKSLEGKVAKPSELIDICYKLEKIIQYNLLLEIGFSTEKAKQLMGNLYNIDNLTKNKISL